MNPTPIPPPILLRPLCPRCGQPAPRAKLTKDFRTGITTTVVECCGGKFTASEGPGSQAPR